MLGAWIGCVCGSSKCLQCDEVLVLAWVSAVRDCMPRGESEPTSERRPQLRGEREPIPPERLREARVRCPDGFRAPSIFGVFSHILN